jgi:hypothetical protein
MEHLGDVPAQADQSADTVGGEGLRRDGGRRRAWRA